MFTTVCACQRPLSWVRMPREFSSTAIARRLVAQLTNVGGKRGANTWACRSRFFSIAARSGASPFRARRMASMPLGLPDPTQCAFYTASLVRREIASLSAIMPMVMFRLSQVDSDEPGCREASSVKKSSKKPSPFILAIGLTQEPPCQHEAASASPDPEAEAPRQCPEAGTFPAWGGWRRPSVRLD